MMSKTTWSIAAIAMAGLGVAVFLYFSRTAGTKIQSAGDVTQILTSDSKANSGLSQSNSSASLGGTNLPSLAERRQMSPKQRLEHLERLGQVPLDADIHEWEIAQKTSWWGRPIEPIAFWKDRPVWLSAEAVSQANRRGRLYPPIPVTADSLPQYAENSETGHHNGSGAEGLNLRYHVTNQENGFWNKFAKTHPRPPEDLELQQMELADRVLSFSKNRLASPDAIDLALSESKLKRLNSSGYPEEAFTKDALYWAYIIKKRRELDTRNQVRPIDEDLISQRIIADAIVDPALLKADLTQAQVAAANGWKIAYLRRLRREMVDESYINGYLKAWNLTAETILSEPNHP